jgi:hypothetical protein
MVELLHQGHDGVGAPDHQDALKGQSAFAQTVDPGAQSTADEEREEDCRRHRHEHVPAGKFAAKGV